MSPPLAWLWAGLGPSFLLDVLIFYFFSGQVEDWQFLVPFHLLPIFPQTREHLEFCLPALSGTCPTVEEGAAESGAHVALQNLVPIQTNQAGTQKNRLCRGLNPIGD